MAIVAFRRCFYINDKTEISEIGGAVLTAHMTPTSSLPAKQRCSRYLAVRFNSVGLRLLQHHRLYKILLYN